MADTIAADEGRQTPATEPEEIRRFRPDIEGLRAVAVGVVLAFHAGVPGFGGGYVGVDVFLVISGFLITGHLLRPSRDSGGRRLVKFYAHRAQRILPAATLTILATLVGALVFQMALFQQKTAVDARSASLFVSNLRFEGTTGYFERTLLPSPFLQFWSLSLEEQFYLLWPALVIALLLVGASRSRSDRRWSAVFPAAAVIGVISFAISCATVDSDSSFAYFTLTSRAWEFLAGGLLAAAAVWTRRLGLRVSMLLPWIGLALIAIAVVTYDEATPFPGWAGLLPVGGAALVILGWHEASGRGNPVLSTWPFRMVGRYSYSLYLWHWPVLILLAYRFPTISTRWQRAAAVTLIVAVPIAIAAYHLVENPVRSSKRIRADWRKGVALGVGLVALSVAASFVYGALAAKGPFHAGRPADAPAFDGEHVVPTEYVPSNLQPELSLFAYGVEPSGIDCPALGDCFIGDPDADTRLVLFGDSHAAEWTPAFAGAAEQGDWRMESHTNGACGSFLFHSLDRPTFPCEPFREEVLADLAANPPDVIVLSNLSTFTYKADPDAWREGVRAGLAALPEQSRIVVLSETPVADDDVPNCLAEHLEDTQACEPTVTPELQAINDELRQMTEAAGGTFVDMVPWICSDGRCPTVTGNVLVYSDDNHLTEAFITTRWEKVHQAVEAVLAQPPR